MIEDKRKIVTQVLGSYYQKGDEHLYHRPFCNHHKKKMSVNFANGHYLFSDIHFTEIIKMKLTKETLKRIIKEELNAVLKESLNDFMKEFSYYRNRGVGKELSDEEIETKFEQAEVKNIPVGELDAMANSYTKLIFGNTEEKRFEKFLDFYLKEKRSKETTRANNPEDKKQYLKNLVKAVKRNEIEDPIVIVEIEGVGSLIAGGRTRAAAAKTADEPARVKIVKFSKSDLASVDEVEKMINDLTI